jgi:hypothetical protein
VVLIKSDLYLAAAVGLVQVDAMRVDRALAQEAGAVVNIEVAARIRKQFMHPADFIQVFGHV